MSHSVNISCSKNLSGSYIIICGGQSIHSLQHDHAHDSNKCVNNAFFSVDGHNSDIINISDGINKTNIKYDKFPGYSYIVKYMK